MNAFRAAFNEKTKLVSITHVSNVLEQSHQRYYQHRHSHNVPVLIDGAQGALH